jgi:hypothetical protein
MKKLKHYLDYLRSSVLWERSRVAAAEGLKARCKQYVAEQVLEFENKEKMKKEDAEWELWRPCPFQGLHADPRLTRRTSGGG